MKQVVQSQKTREALNDEDYKYHQVQATPLLEVFSVGIYSQHSQFNDGRPCEIYGLIQVTDENNTVFTLYNRGQETPEILFIGGNITLIGPNVGVISSSTAVMVEMDIKDKIRDAELAKGVFYLDCMVEGRDEKARTKIVHGEHGFAAMHYIPLQFAITASVEVALVKEEDDGSNLSANVYGSLFARYGSDCRCSNISSTLFRKSSNEPVEVKFGTPIMLSRCVIVVPAYSSLLIDADLWDGDSKCQIFNVIVEFQAKNRFPFEEDVGGQNGVLLRVKVHWMQPLELCEFTIWKHTSGESLSSNREESEIEQLQKRFHKLLPDQQSPSDIMNICREASNPPMKSYLSHVEVFSVSIYWDNTEVLGLYGMIQVFDNNDPAYLYKRDKNDPEILSAGQTASLAGPSRCFKSSRFWMILDLKDAFQEREVSKGFMDWGVMREYGPLSRCDKHLCSVIRGDHGFAVVHYAILSDAVQALIEVSFTANSTRAAEVFPVYVYGTLDARYGNFEYYVSYDSRYYKRILFDKSRENPLCLTRNSSRIPLPRPGVSVPTNSYLIIQADLSAIYQTQAKIEDADSFKGVVEFMADFSGRSCKKIHGQHFTIEFTVLWKLLPGDE